MADVDVEEQWAARRQLSRIGLAVIGLSLGFSAGQPAAAALLELFLWHTHTHCTAAAYCAASWRRRRIRRRSCSGSGGVAHTSRSTSLPRLFQPATPKKRNLKWSFCRRAIANELEHNVQSWKKILSDVIQHKQINVILIPMLLGL